MKIFFAFLLIVFLAFSGYHLSFRKFQVPLFARKFYLTGLEFIFLGLLLGPLFFNILDEKTCEELAPLTALILGWIGMLFGFQFEYIKLKRFSRLFFGAGLAESLVTLLIVFSVLYLALPHIVSISEYERVVIASVLASAAACTAQTGLALFPVRRLGKNQPVIKLLRYISSIDGLIAMLALMPIFVFFPDRETIPHLKWLPSNDMVIAAASFVGIVILFNLFLVQRREQSELALIIIGMVVFISGFTSVLNFSPLVANFFMGVFLVNMTSEKEKIYNTLVSIEKPVYIILLVFIGSVWQINNLWWIIIAAGYCLLRIFGKIVGGASVSLMGRQSDNYPVNIGLGLIGQGGLPLAILFDFYLGFEFKLTGPVLSIALLSIIYNDLLSPTLLSRLLKKEE
jgi:hypothetical protein